jgi:hypothetical protein
MSKVQIAFYKKERGWLDDAIRWYTGSPYSHCELVVDGTCYSSSIPDGGVRSKRIDINDGGWDVLDLPGADGPAIKLFHANTDGCGYDYVGVFLGQLLKIPFLQLPSRYFCSEWCAEALGIPDPASYSPGSLSDKLRRYLG